MRAANLITSSSLGRRALLLSCWLLILSSTGTLGQTKQSQSRPSADGTQVSPAMLNAVDWSPDGRTIATIDVTYTISKSASNPFTPTKKIILVDAATGNSIRTIPSTSDVTAVMFSPDQKFLALAAPHTITLWDLAHSTIYKQFSDPTAEISTIVFSSHGKNLTFVDHATVRTWPFSTGKETSPSTGPAGYVHAFSRDGETVVTCNGMQVSIWDTVTQKKLRAIGEEFDFDKPQVTQMIVAISDDKELVAGSGSDGNIHIWDTASSSETRTFPGYNGIVTSFVFAPDKSILASGGFNAVNGQPASEFRMTSLTDKLHSKSLPMTTNLVVAIIFSRDGRTLMSAWSDGTITFWNVETLQEIRHISTLPKPTPSKAR